MVLTVPLRDIVFFYPGRSFPAVSITGRECRLGCDHCRGRYLRGMIPAPDPDGLVHLARELERRGAEGMLISGGHDDRGRLPLDRFTGAIARVKEETDLLINLHTGFLGRGTASDLVAAGVDAFSLDLVQDPGVIQGLMHLDAGKEDYRDLLETLESAGARAVPHLCVGLPGSTPAGEGEAVALASDFPVSGLILLGFLPTPGTPWEGADPPPRGRLISALSQGLDLLDVPVMLGCMRSRADRALEREFISSGGSGIAVPSGEVLEWAQGRHRVTVRRVCCALNGIWPSRRTSSGEARDRTASRRGR